MKNNKSSKRLIWLLLLLAVVAVGGAYVLQKVDSGEGMLAAAVYKASGVKAATPLQNDYMLYGNSGTNFGLGNQDYFTGATQYGDIPLPKRDPEKCPPFDLMCKGGKIKDKVSDTVDKRNLLADDFTACANGGGGYIIFEIDEKTKKPINPTCNTGKPPKPAGKKK